MDISLTGTQILDNISCSFNQGMITTIVGPSGAGKSTLLKGIVKLVPSVGKILYDGNEITTASIPQFRKEVIYVSQVPVVFPGSVASNINWGREIWELPAINVSDYLQLVGLDPQLADQSASSLSVGQQQRLHLARSLALEPRVLLLDEPSSALDAISKEAFEQLILQLNEQINDLTIVMITHDLNQAKRLADAAILIDKGRIKLASDAKTFFEELSDMSEAKMLQELIDKGDRS